MLTRILTLSGTTGFGVLLLAGGFFSSATTSASTLLTGEQLLKACSVYIAVQDKRENPLLNIDALFCAYWMDGFRGARLDVIHRLSVRGGGVALLGRTPQQTLAARDRAKIEIGGYCEPETVNIPDLVRHFVDYMQRHPQSLDLPAYYLASLAFRETWPCTGLKPAPPPPAPAPVPVPPATEVDQHPVEAQPAEETTAPGTGQTIKPPTPEQIPPSGQTPQSAPAAPAPDKQPQPEPEPDIPFSTNPEPVPQPDQTPGDELPAPPSVQGVNAEPTDGNRIKVTIPPQ